MWRPRRKGQAKDKMAHAPGYCTCATCTTKNKQLQDLYLTSFPSAQLNAQGALITAAHVTAAWNYLSQSAPALNWPQSIPASWAQRLGAAPTKAAQDKDALKKLQKAPESTDVCRGWRAMFVDEKYQLVGSYGATWETKTMQAKCNLNANAPYSLAPEHLAAGICSCGIWSHKNYPEYLEQRTRIACGPVDYLYESENANRLVLAATSVHYGIVIEGTEGYRSEYADLDALWVIVPRKCRAGHGLRLKTEAAQAVLRSPAYGAIVWRDEVNMTYVAEIDGRRYHISDLDRANILSQDEWVDDDGNPYVPHANPTVPCRPQWECVTDGDGDSNPGAAIAMALQASYGIPCRAIGAAEFIYKQERGEI